MLLQRHEQLMAKEKYSSVSIPQAVGAVATVNMLCSILILFMVSIPQAVGAVATLYEKRSKYFHRTGFNTASGRCCCNRREELKKARAFCAVSIPQAVGAVATAS